jgi:BON domain
MDTAQNHEQQTIFPATPVEPAPATFWPSLVTPSQVGQGDPIGPTDNGPRNYTRPDAFILDDVAKVLAWDPIINAFDLNVNCTDGHVHVNGIVASNSTRRRLEALVASVLGVRGLSIRDVVVSKGIEAVPETEHEGDEQPPTPTEGRQTRRGPRTRPLS